MADNEIKPRKTSKGKQKIEIKFVEKKTSRQVMFTKRRAGLFRKCDKLCSEFGAQAAAITVSEAGNFFTYGNPNPDRVIQRYIDDCNCSDGFEAEESKGSSLLTKNNDLGFWWDRVQVDDLGLSELQRFKAELEGLRSQVITRLDEINMGSTSLIPPSINTDFGSETDYHAPNVVSMSLIPPPINIDFDSETNYHARNVVSTSLIPPPIKPDYGSNADYYGRIPSLVI